MFRILSDENVGSALVRALRRCVEVDLVRVQDVELSGVDDARILEWCAQEGRILLSRDRATIPPLAFERVALGQSMPGVLIVRKGFSIRTVADELQLIIEESTPKEWHGRVTYLP